MKVQFDSNTRTDKNRQCITGGIFYCRVSAGFSVSASNKLSCNLTGQCFEIGNKNIPPNRYRSVVENDETQILEICAIEKKSSFGKLEKEIGCGTE